MWVRPLGWEDTWRRKWQPTPVFLPGKSHGQRSLEGYSPWGRRVRHNLATKQQTTTTTCHITHLELQSGLLNIRCGEGLNFFSHVSGVIS